MSNLLALIGIILVIAAIVALTGPWWGVLATGCVFLVAGYSAHLSAVKAAPRVEVEV